MADSFLLDPSKKRRRPQKKPQRPKTRARGSDVSSDSDTSAHSDPEPNEDGELDSDEEFGGESAADKRRRLAKQYLQNLKDQEITGGDFDAQDEDDDIVGRRLKQDLAETQGRMYKFYGARVAAQLQEAQSHTTRIGLKNVTAVAAQYPYVYTVAKDMTLTKWRVDRGKAQRVKHSRGGRQHVAVSSTPSQNHHCGAILCVAVSDDGRYVVTGGEDARLLVWSLENLTCLRVMETRAAVNAVTFRKNLDQLYAACADLRIRTYSVAQMAQLEILYGHQDNITDISALARELCVSVGSRDKTAMYWKIADELRLTFRGGDLGKAPYSEGSLDAVAMLDETHFVSGSDNGNVSLWLLLKKKPVHTQRTAHGVAPAFLPQAASAEADQQLAQQQIPQPQPHWITAVHAVAYLDIFVTGSYDGAVRFWQVDHDRFRLFALLGLVPVRGCVVGITSAEVAGKLVVCVATSKEHRLGRWLKVDGRNALVTVTFSI